MAANIYVGIGRSGAPPLPVEDNNGDVYLLSAPTPVGTDMRACDVEVDVRNSGTSSATCYVRICYQVPYMTGVMLIQCWHAGIVSMTSPATVTGGGPAKVFRTRADIPAAPSYMVGVVYVNNVFYNQTTMPDQNPVCGVKYL